MRLYMEGWTLDMGHLLPIHSAPMLNNVRYDPIATVQGMGLNGRDVPLAPARWSGSSWSGRGRPIRWLGNLHVRHFVVVSHCERLLTTTVCAGENLVLQIKSAVGGFNQ